MKSYKKLQKARRSLSKKFMCMIIYEMINKVFIPSVETLVALQVCWKEPFAIAW
jgi:hypothetical protein